LPIYPIKSHIIGKSKNDWGLGNGGGRVSNDSRTPAIEGNRAK
jgi:hypothetical protein